MAKTHTLRALGHYSIAWQFGLYHGGYGYAMIFEILLDSFTLFEKESARPDAGGYHRRKVVYKCALGKR